MRLNKKTYYTLANQYISASKIKEFIKSPEYFYKQFVTGEIEREATPSMNIGKAVDCYITESKAKFLKTYKPVDRRNLKNPPTDYVEMTNGDYETSCQAIASLIKTSVYKIIKRQKYKSQKILKIDRPLGQFPGLAGIPDWFKIEGNKARIIDLKTTRSIEKRLFSFDADDRGYWRQQAFYQMLVQGNYPEVETMRTWILAVENNEPYRVRLFEMDQGRLEWEKKELALILDRIAATTDFSAPDVTFEDSILLE